MKKTINILVLLSKFFQFDSFLSFQTIFAERIKDHRKILAPISKKMMNRRTIQCQFNTHLSQDLNKCHALQCQLEEYFLQHFGLPPVPNLFVYRTKGKTLKPDKNYPGLSASEQKQTRRYSPLKLAHLPMPLDKDY